MLLSSSDSYIFARYVHGRPKCCPRPSLPSRSSPRFALRSVRPILQYLSAISKPLVSLTDADIVSLYIPEQTAAVAYTASNAGTDGRGHTTWVLNAGQASGTIPAPDTAIYSFPCTHLRRLFFALRSRNLTCRRLQVTIVEGATDLEAAVTASYSYPPGYSGPTTAADPPASAVYDCGISGTVEACTVKIEFSGTSVPPFTVTTMEILATKIPVQVADSASSGAARRSAATVTSGCALVAAMLAVLVNVMI